MLKGESCVMIAAKKNNPDEKTIDVLLEEERTFDPEEDFVKKAVVSDPAIYEDARKDPENYWAHCAGKLDWFKKWDTILEMGPAERKVVHRRHNKCELQLRRPAYQEWPEKQGGDHLGGRTRR